MGLHIRGKELHIVEGRAALGKAGGGFDIIRSGLGHHMAHVDLLFVRQQASLDDDLQKFSLAGLFDLRDLVPDGVVLSFLHPTQIDHHIHLVRAVIHRVPCHKALGLGGVVAVREANDRADREPVPHVFLRLPDKGSGNADGCGVILHTVVADSPDILPGGRLAQEGVIALAENFRNFHCYRSPLLVLFWPWSRMTRFSRIPRV